MNDKLDTYVDGVFAPYEGAKSVRFPTFPGRSSGSW